MFANTGEAAASLLQTSEDAGGALVQITLRNKDNEPLAVVVAYKGENAGEIVDAIAAIERRWNDSEE